MWDKTSEPISTRKDGVGLLPLQPWSGLFAVRTMQLRMINNSTHIFLMSCGTQNHIFNAEQRFATQTQYLRILF